jgi:hypothetical protein
MCTIKDKTVIANNNHDLYEYVKTTYPEYTINITTVKGCPWQDILVLKQFDWNETDPDKMETIIHCPIKWVGHI